MGQFHFHPEDYLNLMHAELPMYDELQDRLAAATLGLEVKRILELGTGTGETARRVLSLHPDASLTGIDVSSDMLAVANEVLPAATVGALTVQSLQDPLPEGRFDLAISALTVHHLDGEEKADLFSRLTERLRSGGCFVMADVVVPEDPADAITPLSPDYDKPSRVRDLLRWLEEAGFRPTVEWQLRDLAVIRADL